MRARSAGPERGDLAPALLAAALCVLLALTRTHLGDYDERLPGADNPAPAIRALLDGDLARYAHVQPLIGLTSLLLRLPFAALGGHDALWTYRLGCLACLLAAAVLAVVVDRRLRSDAAAPVTRLIAGAAIVANPFSISALDQGHPEEILGAALVAGAVLAGLGRRAILSGVLLGLAIGTKQWALVAAGPVALALPRNRWGLALAAAVVAAALTVLPGVLASPHRYRAAAREIADYHRVYPQSAWWPVSLSETRTIDLGGETLRIQPHRLPLGLDRGTTSALTLVLAVLATALLLVLRASPVSALALLVALLGLRALLDPADLAYYLVPWALAAIAWAAWRRDQVLHVVGVGALLWLGFTTRIHLSGDLRFALVALAAAAQLVLLTARFEPSRPLATLASPEKGGGPYR
jgi:hypothetical protein